MWVADIIIMFVWIGLTKPGTSEQLTGLKSGLGYIYFEQLMSICFVSGVSGFDMKLCKRVRCGDGTEDDDDDRFSCSTTGSAAGCGIQAESSPGRGFDWTQTCRSAYCAHSTSHVCIIWLLLEFREVCKFAEDGNVVCVTICWLEDQDKKLFYAVGDKKTWHFTVVNIFTNY